MLSVISGLSPSLAVKAQVSLSLLLSSESDWGIISFIYLNISLIFSKVPDSEINLLSFS